MSPDRTGTTLPKTIGAGSEPAGFTTFKDSADRFTISVPADWRQINPSSPGAKQALADLAKANPKFSSLQESGDMAAQGLKFLAADTKTGTNVNIVVKAAPGVRDSDMPEILASLKSEYPKMGLNVLASRNVTLSHHKALQIELELGTTGAAGDQITIHEAQDLIAANDFIYIMTLTGDDPKLATIEKAFVVS